MRIAIRNAEAYPQRQIASLWKSRILKTKCNIGSTQQSQNERNPHPNDGAKHLHTDSNRD